MKNKDLSGRDSTPTREEESACGRDFSWEEIRREQEDDFDLRGRDSFPTCEEETKQKIKRVAVKKRRALKTRRFKLARKIFFLGRDSP